MLMVIFGAGASYDSVPSLPPRSDNIDNSKDIILARPPLTDQLFDGRPSFIDFRTYLPDCHPIIPFLQNKKSEHSIESILQALQIEANINAERKKQLVAIKYYLRMILADCQLKWEQKYAKGVTNHLTLLDEIRDKFKNEIVCLVTFNYDTLIESALAAFGMKFETMMAYINDPCFKLFKLHGSTNWVRTIQNRIAKETPGGIWGTVREIISRTEELKIDNVYHINIEQPPPFINNLATFPAIAIPVEEKLSFECPFDHVEMLKEMIPNVDRLLTIGWKAGEEPFLEMLSRYQKKEFRIHVVSGNQHEAQEIGMRIQKKGIKGNYSVSNAGFTEFVLNREVTHCFGSS